MSNIAIVERASELTALPPDVLSTRLSSFTANYLFTATDVGLGRGDILDSFEQNLAKIFATGATPRLSGVQIKAPMFLDEEGTLMPSMNTTPSRRARTWQSRKKRHEQEGRPEGALHVLVDGTGLKIYGAGQWLEEKHGARSRRGWRKLHLALDADSGEIVAHTLTDQDTGDVSQVAPLLDQIAGPTGQFTADGAYNGKPIHDAVIAHSAAAVIVISPRANAVKSTDERPPDQRDQHIAAIGRDGNLAIQVHHRAASAGKIVSRAADRSPHRLHRSQPYA